MNTAYATTRMHRKDSAKGQPSRGAQAKALPISNDPMGCALCSGAATTARGMILGCPAVGSRDGPCGTCPHPKRGQSAAAPRRGIAPTGGVYAIGGGTRGSGKRAEAQRVVSRGMARSGTLGWTPAPESQIQCAKRLARAQSALD